MSHTPYDGPIVDAHHHLWDLSMGCHPWLADATCTPPALAEIGRIAETHLPEHYRRDAARHSVVATVHVEALWAGDPVEETRWLDRVAPVGGVALRCVAQARLGTGDGPRLIAEQAAFARVAGVREILSHHPDPARSLTPNPARAEEPAFRRHVGTLARHGLLLDVMLYPAQAAAVADLGRAFPELPIVVDHCASPVDRDPDGMRRWRDALRTLAAVPNISLKASNAAGYDPAWTRGSLGDVVRRCIDAFGPSRVLFGTDHPVARTRMDYDDTIDLFAGIVMDLEPAEQRNIFHDNACRLFGIDLLTGARAASP